MRYHLRFIGIRQFFPADFYMVEIQRLDLKILYVPRSVLRTIRSIAPRKISGLRLTYFAVIFLK